MTTQSLAQAISLRHELPLEELLKFAPQLSGYVLPKPIAAVAYAPAATRTAAQAFWTTFTFGCAQAVVLFALIYAYFAR